MTATDDILALARNAAPADQAAADIALFDEAVIRGMNSDVVRALRTLRPHDSHITEFRKTAVPRAAALPDAKATPTLQTTKLPRAAVFPDAKATPTLQTTRLPQAAVFPDSPAWRAWLAATAAIAGATPEADDPTVPFVVCAAATALGEDCAAAVTAGVAAGALVESRLASTAGWSVPAVAAVIGAGLAAGLMLGLPEPGLRQALGVCATQAAGLSAAAGTDAAALQAGKAAFNAVEAAQLARLGFTSSAEPLDGRRGLFALFSR